jgi:hypothetical protein
MSRAAWPLVAAVALSLIWIPILGRGFSSDDFERVPTTWANFLDDPLQMDGRPLDVLSFALLPKQAAVHHAVSLLIYLGCIGLMWRLCQGLALRPWSAFLALSSFFHPAFLWGVTWIAQRATLLVIFFVLAAIAATRTPARLIMIVTGSAVRTPYIFQNLVFSFQSLRRRQFAASVTPLLCLLFFGFAGYVTYYNRATSVDTLANPFIPVAVSLLLRVAKLLEGVFYVFAPIPMFAVDSWGPALALLGYAVSWIVIARSLQPIRKDDLWLPAMSVAMWIPFVFASEVRVAGEAAVMTFLAVARATSAEWRLSVKIAAATILALNLIGIALNYGVFASQQYDIRGTPVFGDSSQPIYAYRAWREDVRRRVLGTFGLSAPGRTFE